MLRIHDCLRLSKITLLNGTHGAAVTVLKYAAIKRMVHQSRETFQKIGYYSRVVAYWKEAKKNNFTPMPNPEGYDESQEKPGLFLLMRRTPLSKHKEIWSKTFQDWKADLRQTFNSEGSDMSNEGVDLKNMLPDKVTPDEEEEERRRSAAAAAAAAGELAAEARGAPAALEGYARARLELMRATLTAFSEGYREAKDEEAQKMKEMKENYSPLDSLSSVLPRVSTDGEADEVGSDGGRVNGRGGDSTGHRATITEPQKTKKQ